MFIPENHNFKPFESKLWLSSPTMHVPELEYMKEAFDTNWMSTVDKVWKMVIESLAAVVI